MKSTAFLFKTIDRDAVSLSNGSRGRRTRRNKTLSSDIVPRPHPWALSASGGQPIHMSCPQIPPTIRTVTTVTRVVELVAVFDKNQEYRAKFTYGNAATPCLATVGIRRNNNDNGTSNRRIEFGLNYDNLVRMLASRFSRSAVSKDLPEANIYPADMFSYIRLDRVRAWGPTGENQIGYPLQLTVYNIQTFQPSKSIFTVLGVYSERSTGDRRKRAAVAIQNPQGKFVPVDINSNTAPKMHVVQLILGYNIRTAGTTYPDSLAQGSVLAVLHVTLSAQCGRDVSAML